jgi:hypothetical protein
MRGGGEDGRGRGGHAVGESVRHVLTLWKGGADMRQLLCDR